MYVVPASCSFACHQLQCLFYKHACTLTSPHLRLCSHYLCMTFPQNRADKRLLLLQLELEPKGPESCTHITDVCTPQTHLQQYLTFLCDVRGSSNVNCDRAAYLFSSGRPASWPWCGANRSAKRSHEAVGREGSTDPLTVGMTCRGRRAATNDRSSGKLLWRL